MSDTPEINLAGLSDAVISAINGLQKMQENLTQASKDLAKQMEALSKDSEEKP